MSAAVTYDCIVSPSLRPSASPASRRLRIGLVWAGRDAGGGLPSRHLRTLTEGLDASFVALQRGERAADVTAEGLGHAIVVPDDTRYGARDDAPDGDDDAFAQLDLLVSVPGATAMRASARGLPVWLLRPAGSGGWAAACAQLRLALAARIARPQVDTCKVCGADAPLVGMIGLPPGPLADAPAAYHRCRDCGLLFSRHRDRWTPGEQARRIAATGRRSRVHAALVADLLPQARDRALLVYGAGHGRVARDLAAFGFAATGGATPPGSLFEVVVCIESLERATNPCAMAAEIAASLAPDAIVLIMTWLQPSPPPLLDWWYVAPGDGRIAIHSAASLARLWGDVGLRVQSLSGGTHIAVHGAPAFARHLLAAAG